MIVVPVLITSCHVSEKLKIGPVTSHITMTARAIMNAGVLPAAFETRDDNISNGDGCLFALFLREEDLLFFFFSISVLLFLMKESVG